MKKLYSDWHNLLKDLNSHLRPSETKTLMILSIVIGCANGFVAFLFHWLIRIVNVYLKALMGNVLFFIGDYYIIFVPAVGGLLAGPLIYYFSQESKGHGVPEVMYAVRFAGGKIRPIVALIKSVTAALTIGSGGSAGSEGPVVQVGASFASSIGQWFKLPKGYMRTLVGAGVAGGIAATFNAPIGGVLFALEVVIQDFAAHAFAIVVLSSVTASVVSKYLLGDMVFIKVPHYQLNHWWELFFYFVLGILSGAVAKLFVKIYYRIEDNFDDLKKIHPALKPMLGGFLVGLIGLKLGVLGTGHDIIEDILWHNGAVYLVLVLIFAKMIATGCSLGSGGSGGIMTPSLYIGAMLGTGYGMIVKGLIPSVADPGAYGLVSMGAVFAGVTHAPMAAIVMIFEFTREYQIILPLMFATVISMLFSNRISKESMYTFKLIRKGIHINRKPELEVLESKIVEEVMKTDVLIIQENMNLTDLVEFIENTPRSGFPVVDSKGELTGIITYDEIHTVLGERSFPPHLVIVKDLMRNDPPFVVPDDNLSEVIKKINFQQVDRLVVVDKSNPKKIVGIISRADILNIYNKLIA